MKSNLFTLLCFLICGILTLVNCQRNGSIATGIPYRVSFELNGFPTRLIETRPDFRLINFVFFYGDFTAANRKHYDLWGSQNLLTDVNFDKTKKTTFYFYTFNEGIDSFTTQTIIAAYKKRTDHNFIVVDNYALINRDYVTYAVPNCQAMAREIAGSIVNMYTAGLVVERTHFVAHGLGTHLAGHVGKEFRERTRSSKKIGRISGLDPTFPMYYPPVGRHITRHDADFVDIIHTDAWGYGAPVTTGTVDFWPNNGRGPQPGCPNRNYQLLTDNDLCSHQRAVFYWAESVEQSNSFLAQKCESWERFRSDRCSHMATAYMGIQAKTTIRGEYFLLTNDRSPFSRGKFGIIYEKNFVFGISRK